MFDTQNFRDKMATLERRHEELGALLGTAEVISKRAEFMKLSREHAELDPLVAAWKDYAKLLADLAAARQMADAEADPELRELARDEARQLEDRRTTAEQAIKILLLPRDPSDGKNAILEIRGAVFGMTPNPIFQNFVPNEATACFCQRRVCADGTRVNTLWGELAWQLGGKKAFKRVQADDEKATSPGDVLRELFNEYGPCLILIDEWVAYARQLHDQSDLPGGSFETHFTFAQTLTECAKTAKNTLLLVSLPASDTATFRYPLAKISQRTLPTPSWWIPLSRFYARMIPCTCNCQFDSRVYVTLFKE